MNQFKKLKQEKEEASKVSEVNVSLSSISNHSDCEEESHYRSCWNKIKSGRFKKSEKLLEEKEESVHMLKKKGLWDLWLIPKMHPNKIIWDLFIIFLAVYNCIFLPLTLSLLSNFTKENPWVEDLNLMIDVFFTVDILLQFRTTEYHQMNGVEITKPKRWR